MDARQIDPAEAPDDDNPPLTAAEIRQSRPATEVLIELLGPQAAAEIVKRGRGRPPEENSGVVRSFRLPKDVVAAYEATGSAWRKLVTQTLRDHMPGRKLDR